MRSDGKPRAGVYRMMLPSESDWSGKRLIVLPSK